MVPSDLTTDWLDKNIDTKATAPNYSGNWIVDTAKSYKICPSVGNCTFNAHFFRNFVTDDTANDY